ncbi:MAG: UDP-2,3-diacylglucosamine diphosphatase [Dokdonella sp.]|uniref:UDP-2,3-diacylglucosamine diphosphatase n=1 Tax=Dokdonella sp. TaxID=2291710 RepID=UPI003F8110E3
MSRLSFRSVFISDVHLGYAGCKARYLLDFLRTLRCERLYLVGDIVDFENMAKRPYWHASHAAVIRELLAIAALGTRVVYIPGNHDAALRRFAGMRVAGVEISLDAVHVGTDGRRYRVSHGDEYDRHRDAPRWLLALGDVLQDVVCASNRRANALLRLLGLGYRPLSILLKMRIGAARRFIADFERRVAAQAGADGFDGHICGHIHYANMHDHAGALYINDGDWVEHCTGLVEHHDGSFELLHWSDRRLSLARSGTAAEPWPLPAAA